jgi:hypothetical protein
VSAQQDMYTHASRGCSKVGYWHMGHCTLLASWQQGGGVRGVSTAVHIDTCI